MVRLRLADSTNGANNRRAVRRAVVVVAFFVTLVVGLSGVAQAATQPTPDHTPTEANDEARRLAKIDAGQGANSDGANTGTAPGDTQPSQDSQPSKQPRSSPSLSIPPAVAWSIAGIVGAILIYLLLKGFTGRAKHTKIVDVESDESSNESSSELRDELTPAERIRPGDAWRKRATDHEHSGEWRFAVRARFRGLLVDLADQGVVTEARGKTAGEYRNDVEVRQPEVAQPFDAAADLFEGAWYGPDEPTQAECDRIAYESTTILSASK